VAEKLVPRVYIVDDHKLVRASLQTALTAEGHAVVGSSGWSDSLIKSIEASGANILLLDLHLGAESGFSVLERLRKSGVDIRTIVLTMATYDWQIRQAFDLGAVGYVLKESSLEELLDGVQSVLKGRLFLDSSLDQRFLSQSQDHMHPTLSRRERQIIEKVARGMSNQEVADELFLSPKTVETYRSRTMKKLNLRNLHELIGYAVRTGLIPPS
jgi:two-component system, NarL family, invasion response regulator UvrY